MHWSVFSLPLLKEGGINWRPPSLSELTSMIFDIGLTHLGSEASNYPFFN